MSRSSGAWRPRDEVAAYAADWRNDAEWIGALDDVRLVQYEPLQAASTGWPGGC